MVVQTTARRGARRTGPGRVAAWALLAAGWLLPGTPGQAVPVVPGEGSARAADGRAPDLVLRGTLTGADHHGYRELPFEVPAGTARITVEFEYTGRDDRTTIDLGLLGPDGFHGADGLRGWSGGNKSRFTVSATDATPSYLPGPIRPGRWAVLLGIPYIRRDAQARYTARVWLDAGPAAGMPHGGEPPLRTEPGWYRGDLHLHAAHSDGSCASQSGRRVPCPLFLTVQAAAARGLDFAAITDHNTTSQANASRALQPYFDQLLLVPGREITTFSGHASLWGSTAPLDFRVAGQRDWNALLRDAEALGAVVSINHPVRPSDETCMGCGWTAPESTDLSRVRAVEVVNGADADTPWSGIPFWEALLARGLRPVAVGGSDNHDPGLARATPGGAPVGNPSTVVHARALSVPALLEGLRAGRVFVDVQGSRDRVLDMAVRGGGRSALMGGELVAPAGQRVEVEVSVAGAAGGEARVVLDGAPYLPGADLRLQAARETLRFDWTADGRPHWLRVEVRGPDGRLWLLGNPVYLVPVASPARGGAPAPPPARDS